MAIDSFLLRFSCVTGGVMCRFTVVTLTKFDRVSKHENKLVQLSECTQQLLKRSSREGYTDPLPDTGDLQSSHGLHPCQSHDGASADPAAVPPLLDTKRHVYDEVHLL